MTMPIIDVLARRGRGIDWAPAIADLRQPARALIRAFDRKVEREAGTAGALKKTLLEKGAAALHRLLGSHFGSEIEGLADAMGVEARSVLVANLAYDLANAAGCSTFVLGGKKRGSERPLLARNLDWYFAGRLLRDHTVAVRVSGGKAGSYALVGWPGFFGALTAVAPGRFAVSVNFVTHASASQLPSALLRALEGSWPVPWAVRLALDEARDFGDVVRRLSRTALLSPVLFTVAGVRQGEAVVIERGPDDYAHRNLEGGKLLVTNHYRCAEYEDDNVDLDELDTVERLACLQRSLGGSTALEPAEALRLLAHRDLAGPTTQHHVVLGAADGTLVVRVPGRRAVTVPLA